jgi:hypothetical protein
MTHTRPAKLSPTLVVTRTLVSVVSTSVAIAQSFRVAALSARIAPAGVTVPFLNSLPNAFAL